MIQRRQSVYMFLAGVLMLVVLFVPIWEKADLATSETLKMDIYSIMLEENEQIGISSAISKDLPVNISFMAITAVVIMVLLFLSVMKYSDRKFQLRLNSLASLLLVLILFGLMYYSNESEKMMLPNASGVFKIGAFLPIVSLILILLANRCIRKDEELIRSSNRIR